MKKEEIKSPRAVRSKGYVERCVLNGVEALRFVPDRRSPTRFHLFYDLDFIPKRVKQQLRHER